MAHIAKYKAHSCGHMLAHYRRDPSSLGRDNIDPSRTHLNATLGIDPADGEVRQMDIKPNWETIERRIERVNERLRAEGRRATRKDAVVMADIVVTLPENVPAKDEDRFFQYTYEFIGQAVGGENLLGGFIHRDEMRTRKNPDTGEIEQTGEPVRDHMHVPFTPMVDGTFNYKKLVPRTFYREFHKELGKYLEKKLGYRPEVELDEGRAAEKALSKLDHKHLEEAKRQVERQIVEPAKQQAADIVRDAERRNAELNEAIADKQGDLIELDSAIEDKEFELQDARERLECLQQAGDRVAARVERLESIVADVRRFDHAGRAEKGAILDRIADRCDALVTRIRGRIAELAERARAAFNRNDWGVDLDDEVREAKEERSPMRLAEAARQAAAASVGLYGGRNVHKPDRGAR